MGQMTVKLFAKYLPNYKITIFDADDWNNNPQKKLQNQDIVILAVPIYLTDEIIKRIIPYLSKNTILADYTSIKEEPLNSMMKHYKGDIIGLHPIFGPTVTSPENQAIVICHGRGEENYKWFVDDLDKIGFHLEYMTAKEHDELMTFVQGIEHFSVYCLGLFLKEKNICLEKITRLASPVYNMELNIVGRLFDQGPGLYADIIMSDKSRKNTISQFANFVAKNADMVAKGDKNTFIEKFKSVKNWMGDFTEEAYKESDRLLLKK